MYNKKRYKEGGGEGISQIKELIFRIVLNENKVASLL